MTELVSEGFAKRLPSATRDSPPGGGNDGGKEPLLTAGQHALELKRRQIAEYYRAMPISLALSYIGSIFTFLLLSSTDDGARGAYWFAFATGVLFFRVLAFWHYDHQDVITDQNQWSRLIIAGNILAGVQWGLLGTWLFVADPGYRALFSVIVIMGYVGGSVVHYSPVRFAHAALAIPAALPTAIYIFFVRDDGNWMAGAVSLFLFGSIVYMAEMQYKIIRARLVSEMENEQFRRDKEKQTAALGTNLQTMEHRAVVNKRAQLEARRRADTLSRHVESTLLPVIECDQDGRIIEWNRAAELTFGYRQGELAETPLGNLISAVGPATSWGTFFDTALNLKQAGAMDVFVRTQDGSPIAVRLYVTPIDLDGDTNTNKKSARAAIIVTHIPTEIARRRADKLVGNAN